MSRLRICLVSREIAPFWGAGIGTYAAQMLRAWAEAGHEAHLITADHEGLRGLTDPIPGVWVHTAREVGGPRPRFAFQRHAWSVHMLLRELHAREGFDLVEFPDYWAEGCFAVAAKRTMGEFAGATLAVRLHTPTRLARALNGEHWLDEEIATLQCAEERTIADADAVVSPTEALLERVAHPERSGQVRAVVPYPLCFVRPAALKECPERERATVLYFGRLERRKGVELLIRAAVRLLAEGDPLRVRLIGGDTRTGPRGGSMREHLVSLIPPAHAEHFRIDDAMPREELVRIIDDVRQRGGVCCFPSVWENFPNVCLEAMARGAVVVGSDAGGMGEIIEHGRSGLLFRGGSAEDLAAKLREALRDGESRLMMQAAAVDRIERLCHPPGVVGSMQSMLAQRGASAFAEGSKPGLDVALLTHDPLAIPSEDLVDRVRACGSRWALVIEEGAAIELVDGERPLLGALERAIASDPTVQALAFGVQSGDTLHFPVMHPELLSALQPTPVGAVLVSTAAAAELPRLSDVPGRAQLWGLCAALCARGVVVRTAPIVMATASRNPIGPHSREAILAQIASLIRDAEMDATVPMRLLLAQQATQREESARASARADTELKRLGDEVRLQQGRIAELEEQLQSARYRLADRLNEAAKSAGLHGVIKSVAARISPEEKP